MHKKQISTSPDEVRVLRPREACKKIALGRSSLYILIRAGELRPIRLGARAVGFYEHELAVWLLSRKRADTLRAA